METEGNNQSPKACRECGNDVSAAVASGESICPWCGCSFKQADNGGMSRRWLWALFFAVFLGSPVLMLVSASTRGTNAIPVLLTGTLVAGGILARLCTKDIGRQIVLTVLFGIMLLVVYGGIAFVGCLVVMGGMKNI